MTQKDAVFSAVVNTLTNAGIDFEVGTSDLNSLLNKQLRKQINDTLSQQFQNGEVELSSEAQSKLTNVAQLRAYVSGLVSNWLRKDTRLTGAKTSSKKKPTSDPQIKALKQLLSSQTDPAKRAEIQGFIERRAAELG